VAAKVHKSGVADYTWGVAAGGRGERWTGTDQFRFASVVAVTNLVCPKGKSVGYVKLCKRHKDALEDYQHARDIKEDNG
jgi:hypothetical protein